MTISAPRHYGLINWIGFWNLYLKEVKRFLNVFTQTVVAPVVTTLLFLAVFTLALGRAVDTVNGVDFAVFLAPGLVMMVIAQNAFANTSSSVVISKVQGNIVDVLMPPISPVEMVAAYGLGGVTRGFLVGLSTGFVMLFFVDIPLSHPLIMVAHGFLAALMLSLLGMIGGIISEKFDHIAAFTNFVITPLSFLSGTFYSIERLPDSVQIFALFNPFFYMIDGFRYGAIGRSDADPIFGLFIMLSFNSFLFFLAWQMVRRGYKLKA